MKDDLKLEKRDNSNADLEDMYQVNPTMLIKADINQINKNIAHAKGLHKKLQQEVIDKKAAKDKAEKDVQYRGITNQILKEKQEIKRLQHDADGM